LVAVGLMGAAAWFSAAKVDWLAMGHHPFLRAGTLFLIITICAAIYFIALYVMGFRFRDFKRRAK